MTDSYAITHCLLAELAATAKTNATIKGPSFMVRGHYKTLAPLVRRGLMTWGDPPGGFTKARFAGVEVTDAGLSLIASYRAAVNGDVLGEPTHD